MGPKDRHQAAPVTSPTRNSEEASFTALYEALPPFAKADIDVREVKTTTVPLIDVVDAPRCIERMLEPFRNGQLIEKGVLAALSGQGRLAPPSLPLGAILIWGTASQGLDLGHGPLSSFLTVSLFGLRSPFLRPGSRLPMAGARRVGQGRALARP